MKVYTSTSPAPNPRALAIILKIKGIEPEWIEIDMLKGDNRAPAYKAINPAGQLPCLITDSGFAIAEVSAIAEYLDEIKPDPSLGGNTAEERAETRMRVRQMDYWIIAPFMNGFRHGAGKDFFAGRIPIHEGLSEPSFAMAEGGMAWLDKQMAGKTFMCGERLSYADPIFFGMMEFGAALKMGVSPTHKNLTAYMERLASHESFGQ
ncbi:MAG: glutathione S-transferase family protein [Alphaproteobacteria bacterium]|nr:glutathione S-transferase family protein [Alphaproteobacteria bacterium]MBE8220317.1 glutathione S-transferase family protein [Alphaproteobacteria bacterium]